MAVFLSEALEEKLSPCLFCLLEVASISPLLVPSSIFSLQFYFPLPLSSHRLLSTSLTPAPHRLLLLRTLAMNDSVADVINRGYSSLSQDTEPNHIC